MKHMGSKTEKIAIPRSLKMAVIRIQSDQDLDWDEACQHLATLAEPNGKKFKQAVSREANRRYKSRHLTELNKAKKTYIDQGYQDGFLMGTHAGYNEAVKDWRVSYPCGVCGDPVYMKPGEKSTEDAVEYLKSKGWLHSACARAERNI